MAQYWTCGDSIGNVELDSARWCMDAAPRMGAQKGSMGEWDEVRVRLIKRGQGEGPAWV